MGTSHASPQEMRSLRPTRFEDAIEVRSTSRIHPYSDANGNANLAGFNELLPYLLSSPNQEDAGSCMYMALTGSVEWWMAKANPNVSRTKEGPLDFSERYMMNVPNVTDDAVVGVKNWITDSIYFLNDKHRISLNSKYRFTKGYSKVVDGKRVKAKSNDPAADYSTLYNWIVELDQASGGEFDVNEVSSNQVEASFVKLPKFERTVIHADPDRDTWNIGQMPSDIITQVKSALLRRKAPVQVVYNHMGYWHAVVIVGFDDNYTGHKCPFVEDSRRYFKGQSRQGPPYISEIPEIFSVYANGENTFDQNRAKRFERASAKLEKAYTDGGGCSGRGVFYVRDSIYDDASEGDYVYNSAKPDDKSPYTKRVLLREYEWLRYLGNHAFQIYTIE